MSTIIRAIFCILMVTPVVAYISGCTTLIFADMSDDDDSDDDDDDTSTDEEKGYQMNLPYSFWEEGENCSPATVECELDGDCQGAEACISGACIPFYSSIEAYPVGSYWGLIDKVQFGTGVDEEKCCFDIDGDGVIDNQVKELLNMAAPLLGYDVDLDFGEDFTHAIESGKTLYAIEINQIGDLSCGPVRASMWRVNGDLDGDGEQDSTPEQKHSGKGVFTIDESEFGDYGSNSQFNRAAIKGDVMRAEGGFAFFEMAIDFAEVTLIGDIKEVRIEAEVDLRDGMLFSKNVTDTNGKETLGVKVGGFIPIKSVLTQFDNEARKCSCLDIDPEIPVIVADYVNGRFKAECIQDPGPASHEACNKKVDGWFCEYLTNTCNLLPLLGAIPDVSSGRVDDDGNTVNDSISFGIRFSAAGGTYVPNSK